MTDMDEIRNLLDEYVSWHDEWCPQHDAKCNTVHRAKEDAARSALLQRVEALREERDAAAAQSFSGHDWNRLLNERDAARAAQKRAEEERDEARDSNPGWNGAHEALKQDFADMEHRALAAETALAAMRAALQEVQDEATRIDRSHVERIMVIAVIVEAALAPAPPAAMRRDEPALPPPDLQAGVGYESDPAALRPPENKEDPTP